MYSKCCGTVKISVFVGCFSKDFSIFSLRGVLVLLLAFVCRLYISGHVNVLIWATLVWSDLWLDTRLCCFYENLLRCYRLTVDLRICCIPTSSTVCVFEVFIIDVSLNFNIPVISFWKTVPLCLSVKSLGVKRNIATWFVPLPAQTSPGERHANLFGKAMWLLLSGFLALLAGCDGGCKCLFGGETKMVCETFFSRRSWDKCQTASKIIMKDKLVLE